MAGVLAKYQVADTQVRKRITTNLWADEKSGKTHFAFTAPGPIAYMWTDKPPDDVVSKFASSKIIYSYPYQVLPTEEVTKFDKEVQLAIRAYQRGGRTADTIGTNKVIQEALEHVRMLYMDKVIEFKADYYEWMREPSVRSIIVDNISTFYSMLMLADFGRESNNNKTDYGNINRDMFELTAAANASDKNVIFISHTGKKYVNDKWTGQRERKGWFDLAKWVQLNATMYYGGEPTAFRLLIENSSHDPALLGTELSSEPDAMLSLDFQTLATLVFPGTSRGDWE